MFKGFKEFLMRGNVLDLAVAVVIGAAFTTVVNTVVAALFNPLIGAIFKADSLNDALNVTVGNATLQFGAVLGALINFVLVALVVYFVFVVPVNKIRERADRGKAVEPEAAEDELSVLAEIRDLLKAQQQR